MSENSELNSHLSKVKTTIAKWLHLTTYEIIDVIMAVIVANRLRADPVWLLVVGPPSHAKTEILRALDGHPNAYFLSNLTPTTLVSGLPSKNGKPDPSLLLRLNDKMLVLKDFTSVLSMRSENQQEILAQLREAYDGQYSKSWGNGKEINWHGQFGLLGAVTPVYDQHYKVISSMGERFLLYRIDGGDEEKMGLQAQQIVGRETEMRKEISRVVHGFIDAVKPDSIQIKRDDTINSMMVHLAMFCAYGRCAVHRDPYSKEVSYLPMPEGTPRLVKQFTQMAVGLAVARGQDCIDMSVYEVVKKIGRDLVPAIRLAPIEYLWEQRAMVQTGQWLETGDVADGTNMVKKTSLRQLEDLMLVGVVNRKRDGLLENSPYQWQLTDKAAASIEYADVFGKAK